MNKNGKALEFASARLRSDKRIVKKAVSNDPTAVYYMSEDARDNKSIILYILKKDGQYFHLASDKLRRDFEVIRTALLHTVERFVIPFLCPDILEHVGWGDALYNFMPKHKKK